MTREELKEHCERTVKNCERWAKHRGEEPNGSIYEEHKLILELLEQEPFQKDEVILTKKEYGELVSSESENGYAQGYDNALEENSLAIERYQNLVDYFDDENAAKTILGDEEEFNKWLKRIKWHVRKADELGRKLESEHCNDAVSRTDVINQIFYSTDNSGDVVLGSNLRKRIEDLSPVIPVRNWIPCSERLPKESDDYLVTTLFDIGDKEPAREVKKNYFSVLSKKWLYENDIVIAWMPLVKPYQPEMEHENDSN